MSKACIFLADGFEEIEALAPADILRRAGVEVTLVSIKETNDVTGRSNIKVIADALFADVDYETVDMLILPGGLPGAVYLQEYVPLQELLKKFYAEKKKLAAICAAPMIFGGLGFLNGRKATIYPGNEAKLIGAEALTDRVVVDEFITTSRGMGTAVPFGLCLAAQLTDAETAEKVKKGIVYGH